MKNDIHNLTYGQMEEMFREHNEKVKYDRDITALPIHLAIQMVEIGIWHRKKDIFMVILPRKKKRNERGF